jgi:hypothetical protein
MLAEAQASGLELNRERTELVLGRRGEHSVVPDVTADAHESLTAACWLAEFVPKKHYDSSTRTTRRRMNLFRRRTIPAGALVHESTYSRDSQYQAHLPGDAVRVTSLTLQWDS